MSNEFSWVDAEEKELITPSISAIAAYRNEKGDIVIRQEGAGSDEDSIIVVPINFGEKLANRLFEIVATSRDESEGT